MTFFMFMPQLQASDTPEAPLLAPGLEITLPEPLGLSLEKIGETSLYQVIVGEIDGGPAYFISAVKIRTRERNTVLWEKLETELRRHSGDRHLRLSIRGNFATDEGAGAWYRGYEYADGQQTHRPVYFLLKGDYTAYWISMVLVEGINRDVAVSVAEALLQRARIVH